MNSSPQNPPPAVDPVSIWLRSQIIDSTDQQVKDDFVKKTNVATRYDGQRSALWTSISEMTGPNRQKFIGKMVKNWPYDMERRAVTLPMHVGVLSTSVCSALIATRINADVFLYNAKAPFLESIKKCPKVPLIFPIYISGIAHFSFWNIVFQNEVLGEGEPCASCLLSKFCAIMVGAGVLLPAASTPAISHYVSVQKDSKIPLAKNLLEFITMIVESSRATWKLLPKLIIFQIAVASATTYSMLWGRNRIFNTMDIDPHVLTDALVTAQSEKSFKRYLNEVFLRFSFLRPFAEDPTEGGVVPPS